VTGWRIVDGAPRPVADEPPTPGPGELVLAVEAAWIPRGPEASVVAGGAAVGRVVAGGEQASGLIGRRGLVGPHLACGECEVCRRGGAAVCPGGGVLGVDRPGTLAERITVPARALTVIEDELGVAGPAAAAIAGEVAIAYAMYVRASIGPREPAAVIGDDVAARFLVEILTAKGVTPAVVTGADVDAARARIVELGHAGKPIKLFATTIAARAVALELAGPRATLVTRVAPGGDVALALAPAHLARELTVHAVVGAHPDLLVEIVALVVRGDVRLDGAVEVVALADLPASLASGSSARALVVAL